MTPLKTIPYDLAYDAHRGTSFVPERRAIAEQREYTNTVESDYETLSALCPDDTREQFEADFDRYANGYYDRYIAHLQAKSRCVSSMIAGPANFPVARMQKRNNTMHNRLVELLEYRERTITAMRKKLTPTDRPIMSGDADAIQRLQQKLFDAETLQETMKACNAAIRKHTKTGRDAQVSALRELGRTDDQIVELLTPDYMGRPGFPQYAITNNNANIRGMKQRLERLIESKSTPALEETKDGGIRVETCPADNRVRLFFPGKPDTETRTKLKKSGFRWTPSLNCWQAFINRKTIDFAQSM